MVWLLLLKFPWFSGYDKECRNLLLGIFLGLLVLLYILVRYLKKTGKFRE